MGTALDAPALRGIDDFLAWVQGQDGRYEFIEGRVVAMAGGSEAHNDVQVNLLSLLKTRLRGTGCKPNGPDLLVVTAPNRRGRFPDASVSCGREDEGRITRPVVLFEILSPESEARDRGEKLLEYRTIPSLCHYVLIAQDAARVEVYGREGAVWTHAVIEGLDAVLPLPAIGVEVPVRGLYDGVEERLV